MERGIDVTGPITPAQQAAVEALLAQRELPPRQRERLEMVKAVWLGGDIATIAQWSGRTPRTVRRFMPSGVQWTTPRGGFFSWLTIPGDATELAQRAVIRVGRAHDPAARCRKRKRGQCGRAPRCVGDRGRAAFERRDRRLERCAVRVTGARIAVAVRVAAVRRALEGRGQVDGLAHCARGGIRLACHD